MLKRRIIPLLLWQDGRLVKTRQFGDALVVGDLVKTCKVYSDQDADELIILNINQEASDFDAFLSSVERLSREVMMPISVGGGIKSFEAAERAFRSGADKVVVNSAHYDHPELLGEISSNFGAQAVVVTVDYRVGSGVNTFWAKGGSVREDVDIAEHLEVLVAQGFGELMIQAIDRDGMKVGYDLAFLEKVLEMVKKPIIVAGGAGNFEHLREAFELGVDAVACGTLFNFGDNNPQRAKAFLRNYGVPLKKSL
jgi:imidazole glycerol-phosphate synthase subunit HisF